MPNNSRNRGPQDRRRVNLSEFHEVRYWSRKFGCTPDQLREAVEKAGISARAVQRALKS